MTPWRAGVLALALFGPASFGSGCALTAKGDPLRPRYFDPELSQARARPASRSGAGMALRLGRVDSSSYLREPIAFQDSDQELGQYDDRRWSERPEQYLRRALARALFEEHGFVRTDAGDVATLDAELIEFTEIRERHVGRLRVVVLLRDEHAALFEQTLTVERPIVRAAGGDEAAAVVRALSRALDEGVERIADRVANGIGAAVRAAATAYPAVGSPGHEDQQHAAGR